MIHRFQLRHNLIRWLVTYLWGRKASCLYQQHYSPSRKVRVGVPQGSVNSPPLFNHFVLRRYAISHLNKLYRSRERYHLDEEAVRNRVERIRNIHHYGYSSARRLTFIEARDHISRNWEQGQGGGVPRFKAVLGEAYAQCLHDGRKEEPLQYLHCRAEQWNGSVGASLVSWLPCLQNRDYDGVLPNCREVEEIRQDGQAVLTQMAEVEHGKPVRHLGGGRACLPYGRCNA